jgi:hypothetical protein
MISVPGETTERADGDRVGHARGGVDIDDEDLHEPLSSDLRFIFSALFRITDFYFQLTIV